MAEVQLADLGNHVDLGIKEKKKMGKEVKSIHFFKPR